MSKPKINARLEHVRRKPDRRKKPVVFDDKECSITNDELRAAGVGFQGSDRDWLEALGADRVDFATGLTQEERLRFATELIGIGREFDAACIDVVRIDIDTDSYIKSLVKDNMHLIRQKAALEERLMHYDQRRLEENTVGRWLDPDPHIQAENERLRDINAKLHDALLKEKAR